MIRKNVATSPELKRMSLGRVSVSWSRHAIERALVKEVAMLGVIDVAAGCIVELEYEGKRVTKLVVRLSGDGEYDSVLVIVPRGARDWHVVTCWTNHKNDLHSTLNKERLGKVA